MLIKGQALLVFGFCEASKASIYKGRVGTRTADGFADYRFNAIVSKVDLKSKDHLL